MSFLMPDEITFEVTQEHIDKGVPNDGGGCACWLALCDAKWPVESVDHKEIVIYDDVGFSYIYRPSPEATSWIQVFDLYKPCRSATLTIRLEDPEWRD